MNRLSSRQRKLVYFVAILLLLIPIFVLGRPASGNSGGGVLAELRRPQGQELGLSEHNLGRVAPTSAAMNLVLLGMRGVAVNLLWMDYIKQQETKNWAQVRSTTESITMLQPHYLQIWRYHGWNMAYNVAAEWDDVRDRYYWIKEGAKFISDGTDHNRFSPELNYEIGRILGQKMGIADEWRVYRKFFNPDGRQYEGVPENEKGDPDPRYRGGVDPELNPDRLDNYLAAQRYYQIANDLEGQGFQQHLMMRHIFRQYPYRCRLDNNGVLNKEGFFGDFVIGEWAQAETVRYRRGVPDQSRVAQRGALCRVGPVPRRRSGTGAADGPQLPECGQLPLLADPVVVGIRTDHRRGAQVAVRRGRTVQAERADQSPHDAGRRAGRAR